MKEKQKKGTFLDIPVAAMPMTSRPAIAKGHASAWIGVGFVKPLQLVRYFAEMLRFENERTGLWLSGAPVNVICDGMYHVRQWIRWVRVVAMMWIWAIWRSSFPAFTGLESVVLRDSSWVIWQGLEGRQGTVTDRGTSSGLLCALDNKKKKKLPCAPRETCGFRQHWPRQSPPRHLPPLIQWFWLFS